MIKVIKKAQDIQLSKNINSREFDCRCNAYKCVYTLYDPRVLEAFENLRKECNHIPVYISSGYRCVNHNSNVDGSRFSKHMLGMAIDLLTPDELVYGDFVLLAQKYFEIIITYEDKSFVHCGFNPK